MNPSKLPSSFVHEKRKKRKGEKVFFMIMKNHNNRGSEEKGESRKFFMILEIMGKDEGKIYLIKFDILTFFRFLKTMNKG